MNHFYITTTLPYVNADPHIGFAMEVIRADVIARFHRFLGEEVIFNTGTDEHGLKIYQKALENNMSPKEYCDMYATRFQDLKNVLNLSYDNFIRTTDTSHQKAAQHFWTLCKKNGDIYKAVYNVKYCVGCELEKTDSELIDSRCPFHPNKELIAIHEENYFFRFSSYQKKLTKLLETNQDFILPHYRHRELQNFISKGLTDFSISRLATKMPWGVPVPDDHEHVMYVWFDALVNYISTLGWPEDNKTFNKFWPGVQIAGKDNLRQQAAMWQAMLLSAGLPPSKQVYVEGFITVDGEKISKSTGNIVDPLMLIKKYGTDAVRYYLLREIPSFDDGDFSFSRMNEIYTSDLSNQLGNLLNRVTTLSAQDEIILEDSSTHSFSWEKEVIHFLHQYHFHDSLSIIWKEIQFLNKEINDKEPWKQVKNDRKEFLTEALIKLYRIGIYLSLFLPDTGSKILRSTSGKITKSQPLFPRIQ